MAPTFHLHHHHLLLLLSALIKDASSECPRGVNDEICSGRGMCDIHSRCHCNAGVDRAHFEGPACEFRTCPSGDAWTSPAAGVAAPLSSSAATTGIRNAAANAPPPLFDGDVHGTKAVCSERGLCDPQTGRCECQFGFEGAACERMSCPEGTPLVAHSSASSSTRGRRARRTVCSGHGTCTNMERLAKEFNFWDFPRPSYSAPWDKDKVYGCLCDEGYNGYDCSLLECAVGDDPLASRAASTATSLADFRRLAGDGGNHDHAQHHHGFPSSSSSLSSIYSASHPDALYATSSSSFTAWRDMMTRGHTTANSRQVSAWPAALGTNFGFSAADRDYRSAPRGSDLFASATADAAASSSSFSSSSAASSPIVNEKQLLYCQASPSGGWFDKGLKGADAGGRSWFTLRLGTRVSGKILPSFSAREVQLALEESLHAGPIAVTFSHPGAPICGLTSADNVATIEFLGIAGRDHRMQ
jgi:hypothetical protein